MAYDRLAGGAPDYSPCRYGMSRLNFRGPQRDLSGRYLAVLGGTETFGKMIAAPYSDLLEEELGLPVANLGCQNAGPDLYLAEPEVLKVAAGAEAVVVQITGAQNLSNRYYRVHPRRNDRFVAATPPLRSLYRDVDFAEIHFTRHLLHVLRSRGEDRFAMVLIELKTVWLQRMTDLLAHLPKQRLLLWMADRAPEQGGQNGTQGHAPWFVDRDMVQALRPLVQDTVELVTPKSSAEPDGERSIGAVDLGLLGLPDAKSHCLTAKALARRLAVLV